MDTKTRDSGKSGRRKKRVMGERRKKKYLWHTHAHTHTHTHTPDQQRHRWAYCPLHIFQSVLPLGKRFNMKSSEYWIRNMHKSVCIMYVCVCVCVCDKIIMLAHACIHSILNTNTYVLHFIRMHTLSSITGVSIVTAPWRLKTLTMVLNTFWRIDISAGV